MTKALRVKCAFLASLACGAQAVSAQIIITGPNPITLQGNPGVFNVSDILGRNVKFRFSGVQSILHNSPDFVVVIPSSGTTPGGAQIALNPSVVSTMQPGQVYELNVTFSTVDDNPPSSANGVVIYTVPPEPPPSIQSVVNTASFQPLISPGAMVSIFGSNLTVPTLSGTYDDTASYVTSLGNTTVNFNGVAAGLLYASPTQINALVPPTIAGQKSVDVVVTHFNQTSAAFTIPLLDTSPAVFTATQNGTGQGALLQLGADGTFTYNSSTNPASAGTAFELFGTGSGIWNPPFPSDISLTPTKFTAQPVSLTIGGQPAKILYVGTVGYQEIWSLLQINAIVPAGLGAGPQQIVMTIGQNNNSQQQATIMTK